MAFNQQRGSTITIPSGARQSPVFTLGCDALLGLYVPTLDTTDLAISGIVNAAAPGSSVSVSGGPVQIVNESGSQVMIFSATTGGYCLGAKALADLAGMSQIKIGTTAVQSADRTFVLSQKVPDR